MQDGSRIWPHSGENAQGFEHVLAEWQECAMVRRFDFTAKIWLHTDENASGYEGFCPLGEIRQRVRRFGTRVVPPIPG